MPSPICLVQDGAGSWLSTESGADVTPGNTVTIKLNDTSARTWSIQCITTDELSDVAAVNTSLAINQITKTATFPAPAAGSAYRFRSVVDNGIGPNGADSTYTATFCIYTLATTGLRVHALDETTESGAFGYATDLNAIIRRPVPYASNSKLKTTETPANALIAGSNTPGTLFTFDTVAGRHYFMRAVVQCISLDGLVYGSFSIEAQWTNIGGTVQQRAASPVTPASGNSSSAISVSLDCPTTSPRVRPLHSGAQTVQWGGLFFLGELQY
jgi:hypothetical protein